MASFAFHPPVLSGEIETPLARRKRLLRWLRDRLAVRGVEAQGPLADPAGWLIAVNAEDGAVTIRLTAAGALMRAVVEIQGEAEAEYEDALAALEDALGVCAAETGACA